MAPHEWDASTYHQVSTPHEAWGDAVLGRLALEGDETVLDLGCGSGKVTRALLDRLPRGRVVAVDGSAAMVAEARRRLDPERTTVLHQDLVELAVDAPADAAVSTATFHWIADHDRLFARVRAALVPGAPFVAQCGGEGNIARNVAAIAAVGAREPFAAALGGWDGPWHYAGAEATAARLDRAGFAVETCWLEPSPVWVDDPRTYLATINLSAHLERLDPMLRDPFVRAVHAELGGGDPLELDYVRLNWVARAR